MAIEHPFQSQFQSLGRPPAAHSDAVNRRAYETLHGFLSLPLDKPGRCILLRAPRAGHGKTHLLARVQHQLGGTHEFIPLQAVGGSRIDAGSVVDDALRRLTRPLPASGGLCVLDLVARRLFSLALQPLVGSGEVPCQDREGALADLRNRPVETFDFHHPNAVTAHWARENFDVLGQRLSVELAQRCGLSARGVAFWVGALFHFASTPVENPVRLQVLMEAVRCDAAGDGVIMERLEALLGLLTQLTRVVLVADDLEGFSADESAALKLASFLGSLRQSVERLDVVISLNQDIWQNAFLPRLSGGLADRLSEVVVELEPLSDEEVLALLESRVPGLGGKVLERLRLEEASAHARGLLRAAGEVWVKASSKETKDSDDEDSPMEAPAGSLEAGFVEEAEPPLREVKPVYTAEEPVVAASPGPVKVLEVDPEPAVEEFVPEAEVVSREEPAAVVVVESPFAPVSEENAPSLESQNVQGPPAIPEPPPLEPIQSGTAQSAPEEEQAASAADAGSSLAPAPQPENTDGDRVDDLLAQFRERYGRGSQ